jgi:hypothetical protein
MEFIVNFILGLIIVGLGIVSIVYNYQLVNTFGRNNWFERHIGPGTTYPVFKLFSMLAILFGFMMMISLHDNMLEFLFSPLTNLLNK